MHTKAQVLGKQLLAREDELDALFLEQHADADKVRQLTAEIANLQGQLRALHLTAHVRERALLSAEQVTKYDALRTYVPGEEPRRYTIIDRRRGGACHKQACPRRQGRSVFTRPTVRPSASWREGQYQTGSSAAGVFSDDLADSFVTAITVHPSTHRQPVCCRAMDEDRLMRVNRIRTTVVLGAVLLWAAMPAMACLLPGLPQTEAERECHHMAEHCGQSAMPAKVMPAAKRQPIRNPSFCRGRLAR